MSEAPVELVGMHPAPYVTSVGAPTVSLEIGELLAMCREPRVLRILAYWHVNSSAGFPPQDARLGRARELIDWAEQLENA